MPPTILLSSLLDIAPATRSTGLVIAFSGAGGKTSALFTLARELIDHRIVVTTTTRMRDPRGEIGRPIGRCIVDPLMAAASDEALWASALEPRRGGGALVIASAVKDTDKISGIHPSRVEALRHVSDYVLVEADGSGGLPIKAPAAWEPVVPDCSDMVVGVIGLDCLGMPFGPSLAHRAELLGPIMDCSDGEELGPDHVLRLVDSPNGLFKNAPRGARRVIVLNKADAVSRDTARSLVEALIERSVADIVVACSLRDGGGPLETAAFGRTRARA